MKQLIALAKKKPQWLANEGYWRILQILRVMAAAPLAIVGIGELVTPPFKYHYTIEGLLFLALSVAAFFAVHSIAWAVVWVKKGFSEAKENSVN